MTASVTSAALTVEKVGRRFIFRGNTYAHKTTIKAKGCKWDPDQGAWYTGKAATAEAVLTAIAATPPAPLGGAPTMLPSGDWGVRVFGGCSVGDTVKVQAKSGSTWTTTVLRIVRVDGDTTVVETPPKAKTTSPARARPASPSYAPRYKSWRPCGYPGCSPHYCDECSD